MLQAAGEAIQALANHSPEKDGPPRSDEDARAAFTNATSRYFSLLSSVDVNLRRQIWALEEANIVAPGSAEKDNQAGKEKMTTDVTILGSLDVGWLNSRNDNVGKEMEAELWEKASSLVALRKQEGMPGQADAGRPLEQ
jgi:hypothetical protein